MRVFQVSMPALYQTGTDEQSRSIYNLISLFAGPMGHCRFMTFAIPATLEFLERDRQKLAMSRPETWERRGLLEEVAMIQEYGSSGDLRRTRHYLVDFSDSIHVHDLGHWRISARSSYPTLPIPGEYAERIDHLLPVTKTRTGRYTIDHSRYKCVVLTSYQLTRTWDWRHPLMQTISDAKGPIVICIDIQKIHPERVGGSAEFWEGMILNGQDKNAYLAKQEAEAALNVRDESVHHVRVLYMLLDKSLEKLKERAESLRKTSSQFMKVDRLLGYQASATHMFSPIVKPGGIPTGHFNTLSRLPAVAAGMWGIADEQQTEGFYVGISQGATTRTFLYLNWKGNKQTGFTPLHGALLGKTGKGKTVLAQSLALRFAEQGVQVVFFEPMGHCRKLLRIARDYATYNKLDYTSTRINVLDVQFSDKNEQYDHVRTLLGFLLNPGKNEPREFTVEEVIAINYALNLTYSRFDWESELLIHSSLTPTLRVFCSKLRQAAESGRISEGAVDAARQIASQLEGLYLLSGEENTFNQQTNLDTRLTERIALFDFSDVPQAQIPLYYFVALSNLRNRIMRSDGSQRGVLFVDEVYRMCQIPSLMGFLATLIKTVRTKGWAVILIDQDLETYIGKQGAEAAAAASGQDITAGQLILNNLSWLVSFGLEARAALQLGDFYDDILPHHVSFLTDMGKPDKENRDKGMAIFRMDGVTRTMYCLLRPIEYQNLLGS